MYNGIINIYKEPGFTSFDVIAKLRGILHQKKIGHTGTLDPEATGVLPVCLGNATKVCELIMDHEKVYEALLVLGISTDTQDFSGSILSENAAAFSLSEEKIERAVESFVGEYEQLPPMYSAKKVNGKHLYELAREGKEIERKKCLVKISAIDILESGCGELPVKEHLIAGKRGSNAQGGDISEAAVKNQICNGCVAEKSSPENSYAAEENSSGNGCVEEKSYPDITADYRWLRIRVTCSKGTYIRTLCNDIGEKLSVGGCMAELKRTKVGPFVSDDALTLTQLQKLDLEKADFLKQVDALFMSYPSITVKEEGMKALLNGNALPIAAIEEACECKAGERVRVYAFDGSFKAIYEYDDALGIYKTVKMFL